VFLYIVIYFNFVGEGGNLRYRGTYGSPYDPLPQDVYSYVIYDVNFKGGGHRGNRRFPYPTKRIR
jgi:hypothetical protein